MADTTAEVLPDGNVKVTETNVNIRVIKLNQLQMQANFLAQQLAKVMSDLQIVKDAQAAVAPAPTPAPVEVPAADSVSEPDPAPQEAPVEARPAVS